MNRENIKRVRDVIAALPKARFNMAWWASASADEESDEVVPSELLHNCGTSGCIAGWTVATLNPAFSTPWGVGGEAMRLLGLDDDSAHALFYQECERKGITTNHAVAVLDHLMEVGVVNWTAALDAPVLSPLKAEG